MMILCHCINLGFCFFFFFSLFLRILGKCCDNLMLFRQDLFISHNLLLRTTWKRVGGQYFSLITINLLHVVLGFSIFVFF